MVHKESYLMIYNWYFLHLRPLWSSIALSHSLKHTYPMSQHMSLKQFPTTILEKSQKIQRKPCNKRVCVVIGDGTKFKAKPFHLHWSSVLPAAYWMLRCDIWRNGTILIHCKPKAESHENCDPQAFSQLWKSSSKWKATTVTVLCKLLFYHQKGPVPPAHPLKAGSCSLWIVFAAVYTAPAPSLYLCSFFFNSIHDAEDLCGSSLQHLVSSSI